MNRNRKQDDDKDDPISDGFASDKSATNSNFQSSTKQRNKGSTDRTFNELVAGDGDQKSRNGNNIYNNNNNNNINNNNNNNNRTTIRDRFPKEIYLYPPPPFSKKTIAIGFILIFCVMVAIAINFINLHSDFQDIKEFYRGYMGRKLLILEGSLTSRTYINQLKEFKSQEEVNNFYESQYFSCEVINLNKRRSKCSALLFSLL
jgi:hypothetical protein